MGIVVAAVVVLAVVGLLMVMFVPVFFLTDDPAQGVTFNDVVPNGWGPYVVEAGSTCEEITAPLIAAQLEAESGWDPQALSPVGAIGLAQFMPATWTAYGVDGDGDGVADPRNPVDAIISMGVYDCALADELEAMGFEPTVDLILAAYNAGIGNVLLYDGVPEFAETQAYIIRIEELQQKYQMVGGAVSTLDGYPMSATSDCPSTSHEANLKPNTLRGLRCGVAHNPFMVPTSGWRPSGSVSTSDHPSGNAVDIAPPNWSSDTGNTLGWYVAHWYQVNADVLGVKYIIFDNWRWPAYDGTPVWIPYTHASGSTSPSLAHEDHVHISFHSSATSGASLINHSPPQGVGRVPFRTAESVIQ